MAPGSGRSGGVLTLGPGRSRSDVSQEGVLQLAQLCHAVVASGVQERLRITLRDVQLPGGQGVQEFRCKAYVGPLSAVTEGPEGRPDKGRLREVRLEVSGGSTSVEIDLGVPFPQEPWALRVKFYHRPVAALFAQEKVAEVVEVIPRPAARVSLVPGGSINLEVLRIVPQAAHGALKEAACRVLGRAIELGVEPDDVEDLCAGARELGPDTLLEPAAVETLERAAGSAKVEIVHRLLKAGVRPTIAVARAAEKAGTPEAVALARDLFKGSAVGPADAGVPVLSRALDGGLPLVAESLLDDAPELLDELPPADGAAAEKAYAAGAWTVLAALLSRGDPEPFPTRQLLEYALNVGHVRLARACLLRSEGMENMQSALQTCLENGRIEIVREALEAQWRARIAEWEGEHSGPPLLALECGPGDEPAECGVCFEPLYKCPGVFVSESHSRVCAHFCCLDCAEHVQDEAADRLRVWHARRDPRIPAPPGPVCPMCRAPFANAKRLTDPTVDPRSFFRVACTPNGGEDAGGLRLEERSALGALCALLPLNAVSFAPRLSQELWPVWCDEAAQVRSASGEEPLEVQDFLTEADFLIPGGMLAWLCDHLLEMKVEGQRGDPPRLHASPAKWFKHFDYDGKGILRKPEVLRGIAKAYDVACLADPQTPARRARPVGVQRLREIVDGIWDEERWQDGVSFEDFDGPGGLAERILAALPGDGGGAVQRHASGSPRPDSPHTGSLTVEEALDRARREDLKVREDDQQRAHERAEKQRQAAMVMPWPHVRSARGRGAGRGGRGGGPGHAGAELLLASLLEAARDGSRGTPPPAIRIQCPFCGAINAARAAAGHRIICGGCRSVFSVPAAGLAAAQAQRQQQGGGGGGGAVATSYPASAAAAASSSGRPAAPAASRR